jgi:hypothetical protein
MNCTSEWKNILTQRYAELRKAENQVKDICIRDHGLRERRTSLHGKKWSFCASHALVLVGAWIDLRGGRLLR